MALKRACLLEKISEDLTINFALQEGTSTPATEKESITEEGVGEGGDEKDEGGDSEEEVTPEPLELPPAAEDIPTEEDTADTPTEGTTDEDTADTPTEGNGFNLLVTGC